MTEFTERHLLCQLVSGEMDTDRGDYLLRDSLHCGVAYGLYDSERLIESITLVQHPDTGRLQLALDRGGEHTFEAMILARYQMNTQVYLHRIRRIYDHYLSEYSKIWGREHYHSFDDVLRHDDVSVLTEIRKDAVTDGPAQQWAKRIIERRHHRVVHETGDNADRARLQRSGRLLIRLQQDFKDVNFFLDDSPVPIHKLSVPGDQEEQQVEDLYIREKNGNITPLAHESAIISKIPKRVRTIRIFTDSTSNDLDWIRSRAAELERTI